MTIQQCLEWGRADIRLLMCKLLGYSNEYIVAHPEHELNPQEVSELEAAVERRELGEPIAKIIGEKEFWSLNFRVSKDTLDPRPDSETLIDAALASITNKTAALKILDLGTGSGCLLLSLLHELPNSQGVGVDISKAALAIAEHNATNLGLANRATFICNNWGQGIREKFDIVISNPPYLSAEDMENIAPEVGKYDPHIALDGGDDGLACYRTIASQLPLLMKPEGLATLEIGVGQADTVQQILKASGLKITDTLQDLAGITRCVTAAQ